MGYRLAVEDKVCVTVKGYVSGATADNSKRFAFTLTMDRLDQPSLNAALKGDEMMTDFVLNRTHGWSGQRLVLDDSGQPAAFSRDALAELLKLPGMLVWICQAYMRDVGVLEKNS